MKIKCLIVDDEPLSQDVLKKYVDDCPLLELAGISFDAFEANDMLQAHDIQLIFLDINMPKLSGIRFVKTLNNAPLIIFTTAYPEYAIEGYEVDATDYLVKPFSFERFLKAVNKAIEKINYAQLKNQPAGGFILLKSDKKVYKVNYDDIMYLQSFGDYVKVFTSEKCLVVHDTFKNMQEQLPEREFVRIHKSYLIAFGKIQYIEGNQVKIGNELIPIGLNYKEELTKRLKEI
ncbi:MAG TPA: LytTR family DNA-binding domain-containing protein [Bacteroidales bacterium]